VREERAREREREVRGTCQRKEIEERGRARGDWGWRGRLGEGRGGGIEWERADGEENKELKIFFFEN